MKPHHTQSAFARPLPSSSNLSRSFDLFHCRLSLFLGPMSGGMVKHAWAHSIDGCVCACE